MKRRDVYIEKVNDAWFVFYIERKINCRYSAAQFYAKDFFPREGGSLGKDPGTFALDKRLIEHASKGGQYDRARSCVVDDDRRLCGDVP